jgi:UDPglucose--hexose-1-phosphate uridylyltransferase
MSEIRENRLTGEWVIVAPERAKRGGNLRPSADPVEIPAFSPTCPFCPGNEALTSEERYRVRGEDQKWAIRSVTNKYSVISATGEVALAGCSGTADRIGDSVNAVGLHEVLIESPRHDLDMALLPAAHVERIMAAYRHRFHAFHEDPRIRHVIIFKNHGKEAGASQQHPHSQVVGLPILPGQIVDRNERARRFYADTGRCLACVMIEQEREEKCRIVAENAAFIAFIPYAALSQYHLWIFPKAHAACFSEEPTETIPALAEILRTILGKLYGMLANPPFNLVVRSLGPMDKGAPHFHWYISIVPRVTHAAGFELGTGMYINPSMPEFSAQALREYAL